MLTWGGVQMLLSPTFIQLLLFKQTGPAILTAFGVNSQKKAQRWTDFLPLACATHNKG